MSALLRLPPPSFSAVRPQPQNAAARTAIRSSRPAKAAT